MTSATIIPGHPPILKTVEVRPGVPDRVHLEMTLEDAQVLLVYLANIGGAGKLRQPQERISRALITAGVDYYGKRDNEPLDQTCERLLFPGSIMVRDFR